MVMGRWKKGGDGAVEERWRWSGGREVEVERWKRGGDRVAEEKWKGCSGCSLESGRMAAVMGPWKDGV